MADAASVDLVVTAKVPEAVLREEFDALVAEGYAGSWQTYLAEQRRTFREYASGWWTLDEVAYV